MWEHCPLSPAGDIPTAERLGIRMAIHPDDPPWPIFGLPKIITSQDNIRKYLNLYDSPYKSAGLTQRLSWSQSEQ